MPDSKRGKKQRPPLEAHLVLEEWGPRGSVCAHVEDRPVQVDRGIPGETVDVLVDRRRRPWRGVVTAVSQPDAHRIQSSCPYYLLGCGGCQWQHVDYPGQLQIKRTMADLELQRAGVKHRVDAVHGMDDPWRYRHTAAIAIGWEAGFRPRGRRGIIELHDCPISHPLIGRLAAQLNDLLDTGRLPNYHGKVWLDTTVVGSSDRQALQVLLQGISGLTREDHPELPEAAALIAGLDGVDSVAYRHRDGQAHALVGDLFSSVEIAGGPLLLPAGGFCQTNLQMLEQVVDRMRKRLSACAVHQAADVYGGIGTFTFALHDLVQRMTLVELDGQSVTAARDTATMRGITNVDAVQRHAEQFLPEMPALDLVIVDPPRSGLGDTVTMALGAHPVPLLFYVSCAPASLARDLAALVNHGYQIEWLELYDFYPQTYHVESLTILTR